MALSNHRFASWLLGVAVLLALVAAVVKAGDESAEQSEAGGLGGLLRRLMFDLLAWLGSLFGMRGSSQIGHARHDYSSVPRGGGPRSPARGPQNTPTADPQDVEHIGPDEDQRGLRREDGKRRRTQPLDSSEELSDAKDSVRLNASPEDDDVNGNKDISVERIHPGAGERGAEAPPRRGVEGREAAKAAREELTRDDAQLPSPSPAAHA